VQVAFNQYQFNQLRNHGGRVSEKVGRDSGLGVDFTKKVFILYKYLQLMSDYLRICGYALK
jgi:hypothetical protein